MKKITLALLICYALIELLAPASANAFGKPKEAVAKPAVVLPAASKPVVAKPATVVPAVSKLIQVTPAVNTPVATKPAAAPLVVKPIIKKPEFKKVANKPAKPKVTTVSKVPPVPTAKPDEPPAPEVIKQPTAGQQVGQAVDQGISSVGGLFDKFKASVKNPVTVNSCSQVQKSMGQC